jgi:hypothetical protein
MAALINKDAGTRVTADGADVAHAAHSVPGKSMERSRQNLRSTGHKAGVIDREGLGELAAECAEIAQAICRIPHEGAGGGCVWGDRPGRAHDLLRVVDPVAVAVGAPSQEDIEIDLRPVDGEKSGVKEVAVIANKTRRRRAERTGSIWSGEG